MYSVQSKYQLPPIYHVYTCIYVHIYCRPQSLEEVITHLEQFLKPELQEFQVRREHVLNDLLIETKKTWFHPLKRVTVKSECACTYVYVVLGFDSYRHGLLVKWGETQGESLENSGAY